MTFTGTEWILWVYYTVYVVGLLGNTLSAAVWSVLMSSVKGAWFLLVLSLSDLLAIVFGIVHVALSFSNACSAPFFLYLQDVFYYYSIYLTVAIVVQRYVSVAYPTKVLDVCSKFRQVVTVVVLLPVALAATAGGLKLSIDSYHICNDQHVYGSGLNTLQEPVMAVVANMTCGVQNATDMLDRMCAGDFDPRRIQNTICTYENATDIIEQLCQSVMHVQNATDTAEHIANVHNGSVHTDVIVMHVMHPAMEDYVSFAEQWLYGQIVISFLAPPLLVIFNVLLLRQLRTSPMFNSRSQMRSTGSPRMKRANRQLTLVALWISATSILVYAVVTGFSFYLLSSVHSIYVERDPHVMHTTHVLVHVRDITIAVTISINFIFYACFCQSFQDVLALRWRQLKRRVRDFQGDKTETKPTPSSSSSAKGAADASTVYPSEDHRLDASTAITIDGHGAELSMTLTSKGGGQGACGRHRTDPHPASMAVISEDQAQDTPM